jgi:hypothetical protein
MQITIDSLIVALVLALAPEQDQGAATDRIVDSLLSGSAEQRSGQQPVVNTSEPAACRYFADREARRKCAIRTSRLAASGSAEPDLSFPETIIWIAPAEPRMPWPPWGLGGPR